LFFFPLVIVDDFHIVAMALTPDKTGSPLIIDPNRVLPSPIASQCFELISMRRSQNAQLRRSVKLEQFPQGDSRQTLVENKACVRNLTSIFM
jgi:hypothetical protein